jgi:hypothetical protein
MDDIKAKQQIIEKIKASANILVTVSNNPSVDALSAALGLTLLLDKLDKHPTAVFSGEVPAAISFLKPEETFDENTDSLRDFIIALDKEKADHLRYKVEGDSVKIFITPYKTTISSNDLIFSQGDFNVELVIALGVDVQEHLDGALESHGQILHDAAIITVTAGEQVSNLGGIDWHDDQASSLSEMVSGLAEALKTDKTKSLIDASIATAFLTGIVAETDRFSNTHTTARVMTTAAQLMAAGADQQLIASKLQESHEIGSSASPRDTAVEEIKSQEPASKESLSISHKPNETLEQMDKRVKAADQAAAAVVAETSLAQKQEPVADNTQLTGAYAFDDEGNAAPSMGGALNATTEQAADDARTAQADDQNKTILAHSYLDPSQSTPQASSATGASASAYVLGHDEPAIGAEPAVVPEPLPTPVAPPIPPAPEPASQGHELVLQPLSTPQAQAPAPMATPTDLGLPMPPALPDFSAPPAQPSAYAVAPVPADAQPELLGDILAAEPAAALPANNPGQFQIPPQQ